MMSLNEIINSKSNEHVLFAGSIINTLKIQKRNEKRLQN